MQTRGYYRGGYDVVLQPYSDVDFSKKCFMFTGQGASFPNMFEDLYEQNSHIRRRFEQADEVCKKYGWPPASQYVCGEDLTHVENLYAFANVALYTLQVAMAESLIEQGYSPDVLVGHSFGEYASLTISGIMSFSQGLEVVLLREQSCPSPNTAGGMIALSAKAADIHSVLDSSEYHIANINSEDQIVISVPEDKLIDIRVKLKRAKLPALVLNTLSQPYHSPLLSDAAAKFKKAILDKGFRFSEPTIPVLSSVSGEKIDKSNYTEETAVNLLAEQLIRPVMFEKLTNMAHEEGCRTFVEVGPGNILNQLIKNNLKGRPYNVLGCQDLFSNNVAEDSSDHSSLSASSPWFKTLQNIISETTGYKMEDVSLNSRFQEDLSIDSIKKAEILFRVLKAKNIEPSGKFSLSIYSKISDAVKYLEDNVKDDQKDLRERQLFSRLDLAWMYAPTVEPVFGREAELENLQYEFSLEQVLSDSSSVIEGIKSFLQSRQEVLLVLYSYDPVEGSAVDNACRFFDFLTELGSILSSHPQASISLYYLWNNQSPAFQRALAAAFKSLKKEDQSFFFKSIWVDKKDNASEALKKEFFDRSYADVRYHQGRRFVRFFKPAPIKKSAPRRINHMVSVGGRRGIAKQLLTRLPKHNVGHLTLLGRTEGDHPEVIQALESIGAVVESVTYRQVDASDYDRLKQVITEVAEQFGPIDVVFNSAGSEVSKKLNERTKQSVRQEIEQKLLPTENLLKICHQMTIGTLLNSSSIVAHFGNDGQSVYSFCNEFLSKTAETSSDVVNHIAINWPAWEQTGMTENLGVLQKLYERGLHLITPEKASGMFNSELFAGPAQSQSIFYLDPRDIDLMNSNLSDFYGPRNIMGLSNKTHKLVTTLDLSTHQFLNEHVRYGRPTLPVSAVIALMVKLSRSVTSRSFDLNHFDYRLPIVLEGNRLDLFAQTQPDRSNPNLTSAEIFSDKPHAICHFGPPQACSEQVSFDKNHFDRFSIDDFYRFVEHYIYLGPSMQVLQEVNCNKKVKDSYSIVDCTKLKSFTGDVFFDSLFNILEVGIQSGGILGWKILGASSFACRFSRMWFSELLPLPKKVVIYSKLKNHKNNRLFTDMYFLNADDPSKPIGKISDIEYTMVKNKLEWKTNQLFEQANV